MTMSPGFFLLLGLFVLLSGVFSGAEIALFSVPLTRAKALANEGVRGAQALARLKSNPERLLVTLLICNNVVNIAAASVATYAATEAFGSAGIGIATGGMTLLILFFGEIIPKTYAAAHALKLSLLTAPMFLWLTRLALPIVLPFEAVSRLVLPSSATIPSVTESEIRALTLLGHQAGAIEEHERELIERAFALDSTRAWAVMTPRTEIFAWPAERKLGEIATELRDVPYSRIPVHGASLDDITGVLHVRDAFEALVAGRHDVKLGTLAREPLFVPHSASLVQLLAVFRSRRIHMGVVVDEHGGTDGIVTLEDILEELVGEITDEHDPSSDTPHAEEGAGVWVMAGDVHVDEVERALDVDLPPGDYETIAGLVIAEHGGLPAPGAVIQIVLPPDPATRAEAQDAPVRVLDVEVLEVRSHVPAQVRITLAEEPTRSASADDSDSAEDDGSPATDPSGSQEGSS